MTTSLRSVTLQTVANYRHAAERTLGATRHGGERLITVVHQGVGRAAEVGAEPYVPALAAAVRRAGDNFQQAARQGLDSFSERTSRAIALGADSVTSQVERVAALADGVDNAIIASGLQAAVRVSLPGAQVALALSERVAAGADKLADVAGATTAKRAARAAGKRVRAAKAEAADVAAEVIAKAQTKAAKADKAASPARRARAQAAAVAEAVAEPVAKVAKAAKASKPAKAVQAAVAEAAATPAVKPARVRRAAKPAVTTADAPVAETTAV